MIKQLIEEIKMEALMFVALLSAFILQFGWKD